MAAGGQQAPEPAAELGDALFATEPSADLVTAYRQAGGDGPRYAEVPLTWAGTETEAAESARRLFRFDITGWKVQPQLPNPVNFDAATALITADHLREQFGCGPHVKRHVEVASQFAEAGFDQLALINAGPDMDGFLGFARTELLPALRGL